jgi:hypothetical protein
LSPATDAYATAAVAGVTDATTLFVCDVGDGTYTVAPTVTFDAVIVYVPGTSLLIVVVAVTLCENELGPVTVIAAGPLGSPLTVTVSEPVEIA